MVRTRKPDRKAQFKAALATAGLTAKEFAEQHGVTPTHLYLVVRGDRQSPRLERAVAELIEQEFAAYAV